MKYLWTKILFSDRKREMGLGTEERNGRRRGKTGRNFNDLDATRDVVLLLLLLLLVLLFMSNLQSIPVVLQKIRIGTTIA